MSLRVVLLIVAAVAGAMLTWALCAIASEADDRLAQMAGASEHPEESESPRAEPTGQ
jgi:hypothetical protein